MRCKCVAHDEDSIWHGTSNGYNRHGCRCVACREANLRQQGVRRERRAQKKAEGLPADSAKHGTYMGYSTFSCKCAACIDARVQYRAKYVARKRVEGLSVNSLRHGTGMGYLVCKCESCLSYGRLRKREQYYQNMHNPLWRDLRASENRERRQAVTATVPLATRWTHVEDAYMFDAHEAGLSITAIASNLGRSYRAVTGRRYYLKKRAAIQSFEQPGGARDALREQLRHLQAA